MNEHTSKATLRKRKQREKLKALNITVVEIKLSARERDMLDEGCNVRGGISGAYDCHEYIAKLIINDSKKLKRDLSRLGACKKCKSSLPQGCDGLFKGDTDCFHSKKARALNL